MTMRIWLVTIPGIPGPDLRHGSLSSAEREVKNAHRKGLAASYRSLLVHVVA